MSDEYEDYNYDKSRARKVAAEADLAETKLAEMRGELVRASDVAKAWEGTLGAMKAKMISIPSKAAPIVASESEASICQETLELLVNEALEELANYEPDVPETTERDTEVVPKKRNPSPKAATKTDGKRVGRPRTKVGRTK